MNPAWSALTLLILSTIMLTVTWMAASRRLWREAPHGAAGERLWQVQRRLLVRAVGAALALSLAMLLAIITVLTDNVSASWCVLHGALLLFCTVMAVAALASLACASLLSVTDGGGHSGDKQDGTAPWLLLHARTLALGLAGFITAFALLLCSFEQRTLFCFAYHPSAVVLVLFRVPMLALTLVSSLVSLFVGVRMMTMERLTFSGFFKLKGKTKRSPGGNERFARSEFDSLRAEYYFDSLSRHGPVVKLGKSDSLSTFTRLKRKLALLLTALSIIAFTSFLLEALSASHDHYFQGDGEAPKPAAPEGPEVVIKESELGYAVFVLSGMGMLVFALLATEPSLWQVHHHQSAS